jgi:hypothetical protein
MARFASQAEYYRHHRRCFELALEMKVTPREAELELQKREVRERAAATHARFLAATQFPPARDDEADDRPREPWMMRE